MYRSKLGWDVSQKLGLDLSQKRIRREARTNAIASLLTSQLRRFHRLMLTIDQAWQESLQRSRKQKEKPIEQYITKSCRRTQRECQKRRRIL